MGNEPQRLNYGQAVLELKAAADADPEIAQAVVEVEAAVNNDQSETAKEIKKLAHQVQQEINIGQIEGQNVQNVYGGEAQQNNAINTNAPVIQGGSGHTITFNQ